MTIQVDEQLREDFKRMARQYPEFTEFVGKWRLKELEAIPYAKDQSLDVLRGRVQALTDLQRLFGND